MVTTILGAGLSSCCCWNGYATEQKEQMGAFVAGELSCVGGGYGSFISMFSFLPGFHSAILSQQKFPKKSTQTHTYIQQLTKKQSSRSSSMMGNASVLTWGACIGGVLSFRSKIYNKNKKTTRKTHVTHILFFFVVQRLEVSDVDR